MVGNLLKVVGLLCLLAWLESWKRKSGVYISVMYFKLRRPSYQSDWLTDWLDRLLTDWLACWLTGWPAERLAGWLMACWPIDWRTDWYEDLWNLKYISEIQTLDFFSNLQAWSRDKEDSLKFLLLKIFDFFLLLPLTLFGIFPQIIPVLILGVFSRGIEWLFLTVRN